MELEKAKEFLAERGINVKTTLEGAYTSKYKLSELITEFAQQNTTLDLKVDDEGNILKLKYSLDYMQTRSMYHAEWREYKQAKTIKQRLDNEKRLRDKLKNVKEELQDIIDTWSADSMTEKATNLLNQLNND